MRVRPTRLASVMLAPALLLGPAVAFACPACASAQRSGPSGYHLVLVLLPLVVVALAARAIYAVLRAP